MQYLSCEATQETDAINSNLRDTMSAILSTLTKREEQILRLRFGIGLNTDHTLKEVGKELKISAGYVNQLEAKALRKLKHPSRSRRLRSFCDTPCFNSDYN
jgi:RNA polymerase primary sigma factor|tara:strand:- start:195 stop:497 length:303 start_codon:yes stop_codon:yes gene_type:complete